jgi:DNA-directed RNA polymerase specialized sigma24 family protein
MRPDDFSAAAKEELPTLHGIFYHALRNCHFRGDIEDHIWDLIQITCLRAYRNSLKENLDHFTLPALLIIKARNEVANFYQSQEKEQRLVGLDQFSEEACSDPDPYEQLVRREEMERLNRVVGKENDWVLLQEVTDGIPYRELAYARNTTEAAIKMKIFRLRQQLRQRLHQSK